MGTWEEIKGKSEGGEFLILDSLFFPAFAGHVTAVAGRAHARFRVDWRGDTHAKDAMGGRREGTLRLYA